MMRYLAWRMDKIVPCLRASLGRVAERTRWGLGGFCTAARCWLEGGRDSSSGQE